MEDVHADLPNAEFDRKTAMKTVYVCADSGLKPTEYCSSDIRGSRVISARVAAEDVPTASCDMHVAAQIDSQTGQLANDYCPVADVKTVGMLRVDRSFPVSGVRVSDGGYVLPGSDSSGYPAASGADSPNHTCALHDAENDGNAPVEPDPNDPNNPTDPDDPDPDGGGETTPDPEAPPDPDDNQDPGTTVTPSSP